MSPDEILADFAHECLYARAAWFVDELLEVDREAGRVVARMHTHALGELVDAQIEAPRHPRHVPAAVVIQCTGTLGGLHAAYVLDLKRSEGWAGFGTHIVKARFPAMGVIGPPVRAELMCTRVRRIRGTVFTDYQFTFTQEGHIMYESNQMAAWVRA